MTKVTLAAAALLAAGCAATPPAGPSILVLPGSTKTFDQFRFDDQQCRGHAHNQVGGEGADPSYQDAGSLQRRYDNAFTQCMYAKGHRVPVSGRYSDAPQTQSAARVPPPPPPPGKPPAEAPPDYRAE